MGGIEIRFAEKTFQQICEEYPKFKFFWEQMLVWVQMIDQENWTDLKYFADTRYSESSNGERSKTILERVIDALPHEGRRVNGDILFKQCWPKTENASLDEKLRKLGKEFQVIVRVVQNYLAYAELMDQKERQKLLLKSLSRKNNYEFFKEAIDKFKVLLDQGPLNLMRSHDEWLLEHLHYNHPSFRANTFIASTFMDTIRAFETFNQLTYLNYYLEALHLNVKLKNPEQLFIQGKINAILDHKGELDELVQLYVLTIKMTLYKELDEYVKLEELYTKHHQKLEVGTHLNIVRSIFNFFFSTFSTTGDEKMAEQSFSWLKKAWDLRLYDQIGNINDGDYINFMILIHFLKKEELFIQFKKEYEPLLDPGMAETVKAFCDIRLLFEKSQYNLALTALQDHFPLRSNNIDPKYDIRVKGLRVMIYLEMLFKNEVLSIDNEQQNKEGKQDVYDLLVNNMSALRQYCSRMRKHRLDEHLLIGNQRFVMIVRLFSEYKLAGVRLDGGEERLKLHKEIKDALDERRPLAYRRWLGKMLTLL